MLSDFRASKIRKSKYYLENMLKEEQIKNKPKKLSNKQYKKIGLFKKIKNWFRKII